MDISVTGANGFVGSQLCPALANAGHKVCAITRKTLATNTKNISNVIIDTSADARLLADQISKCQVMIHLAGQAHNPKATDNEYFSSNVEYSLFAAKAANLAGIKRLIYMSSIKVNGERTVKQPFHHTDQPHPEDIYGRTKWAAENALQKYCKQHSLELVIIRPALIWGEGAKGNLALIKKLIRWYLPLPLANIHNQRATLTTGNLIALIERSIETPDIDGQIFLAANPRALSTTEMARTIAAENNRPSLLFTMPPGIKRWLVSNNRTRGIYDRLFNNLEVDIQHTVDTLGWQPNLPTPDEITK